MAGAQVNIAELRRFSSQLRAYSEKLKQNKNQLLSALGQLGQAWDDDRRKQFEEQLQQATTAIDNLTQRIESTELPYLQRKIQAGERYLGS